MRIVVAVMLVGCAGEASAALVGDATMQISLRFRTLEPYRP